MDNKEIRIVYMGTPDFAVAPLQALVEGGYRVVGVITMPDKPMGRSGNTLQSSPVKKYAESVGLPLLQPEKLKDPIFLEALKAWEADLQVVVAFRMLPEVVWDMPPLGTFNLHASLLPQYRGAAPINWAVINGEKESGVTTFFLTHGMDMGKIILQRSCPIAESDDAGVLHDALMSLGASLVTETVDRIADQSIAPVAQSEMVTDTVALRPAPKIFNDTCQIDWSRPVDEIYNHIRGLAPYPAAWSHLEGKDGKQQVMKIYLTERHYETHDLPIGTLRLPRKNCLEVAVNGGFLRILSMQLAGKKRMDAAAFLNGFKEITEYRLV
ncbi:methionyl-tRNA formyltransferase [Parabacteroides sp. OttesenSCG-928-N08]|nr:methionyl-tRNA formyltransferase [Parabacteroides sp. OttesenSCG-928-N08]